MQAYSKSSETKLNTAHPDLIAVFTEVVKEFDNKILYGSRSPEVQFILYKKGRELIDDKWVIVKKSEVVTYKDGFINKSKHNFTPSSAVDAIPYPVDYSDINMMCYFAGHVMSIANRLRKEGKITHKIKWGADWNLNQRTNDETFLDYCHFEIIKK